MLRGYTHGMQRLLLVMRHGKSDRDLSYSTDHERPLAARGRRDAPRMAQLMQRQGVAPQLILSSDAQRACQTAQLIGETLDGTEVLLDGRLYAANPEEIITALHDLPDDAENVLVVGHNPGLEMLVDDLCGRNDTLLKTCSVAVLQLTVARWAEIGTGSATLRTIVHPREMDSEE
jgi:phosphohistidine phosphatase